MKRAVDWGDIAEAAGVPRQAVEAAPVAPHRIPLEDLGSNLDKGICGAILSVKDAASWSDYAIDFQLCGLLMHGPNLLTGLARLPTLNALRSAFAQRADSDTAKVPGDWIHSYCRIDIQERSLRLAVPDDEASALHFVEAAWPGWAVSRAEGGPAPHFAETGREAPPDLVQPPDAPEPEPPNRPMEECLRMIEEHMAGAETRKAAHLGWRTQLQNRLDAEKGPMIWAPRFLRPVPGSRPGWFRRLLHRWRNR